MISCLHPKLIDIVQEGNTICATCGQVIQGDILYSDQVQTNIKPGVHPLATFDVGLSSVMSNQGVDVVKKVPKKALAQLLDSSRKAKTCSALSKNKFRGMLQLQRLCNLLQVPAFLQPIIRSNFVKFSDRGYLKGRNLYSCILSFLVICAAEENVPVSINEALKKSEIARRRFNRDYYAIYKLYEEAPKMSAQGKTYLQRSLACIDPSWIQLKRYLDTLYRVLDKIQFETMVGRIGIVSSVTVVYQLLKAFKYPKVQEFSKQVSINKITIQNRWKELQEQYGPLIDDPLHS